jgi:hypothetical protein
MVIKNYEKKLHGLSPRANYTDRGTAACREMIANFCHVVSVTGSYDRIIGFQDRSLYFYIKYLLSCTHEAKWTSFQTHYLFFLVVPGIEPGPLDL